ncbi:MAG: ADP-forming succinate--CoA ligase subunit beta [Bacteroidota bacterium]|nr:ADP-forming succinate--CoA ligase subunit beta [Candidatus Kapabacteria bacterium]MDW8219601.1 ADP-forming succinate--CoA ligase subunit beta [Bacteroidota bacterium]
MNIHEYQAKALLRQYGVPVPTGVPVFSPEHAGEVAYRDFVQQGHSVIVLKSQIHAGGRGKGTVHDVHSHAPIELDGKQVRGVTVLSEGNLADRAYRIAKATFHNKLVTVQTGSEGKIVRRMFIEQGVNIAQEYYLSILLDRSVSQNLIMASTEGGMDIEEVAAQHPEKILREHINPVIGFRTFQARRLGIGLGLSGDALKSFVDFLQKLYTAYEAMDCSLLEINPLVCTTDQCFIALDAKVNFDDNALYRHPEYNELRDLDEEEPLEIEASKYDLNYIKLDGNVGCMVNGAGLAMATMDVIQLAGGKPANFLDVGGGANVHRIANAFRIMLSDPHVQAVFINIFGGIVRCDRVAHGIIQASQEVHLHVPCIIRLDGTNAQEARRILEQSGLQFSVGSTLEEAAMKVKQTVDALCSS